jgi:hypothetical protein
MLKTVETDWNRMPQRMEIESQELQTTVDSLIEDLGRLLLEINWSSETQVSEVGIASTPSKLTEITPGDCQDIVRRRYVGRMQALHSDYFAYISLLGRAIEKAPIRPSTRLSSALASTNSTS